jgi:phospholipid/cholesterol/gamma-HCH transport system permease protein
VDGIKQSGHKGEMHVSRPAVDTLFVRLSGSWTLQSKVPTAVELQRQLEAETGMRRLVVEARELTGWDSGLVTFLRKLAELCVERQIAFHRDGLLEGSDAPGSRRRRARAAGSPSPSRAGPHLGTDR